MNKKEKTRFILNSYLIYKNNIKNIDLEIEEIENNYDLSGVSLEEKTAPTNKISNAIESRAIAKPERIEKMKSLKRSHEIKCEKIENAIEILKEFEKQVIELKYMTPPVMTWFSVSNKLNFTISACKQAEDRAVNKMIPLLISNVL